MTLASVVISAATERLVGPYFELRALAPATLRGFARPVRAFEVLGERAVRGRLEAMAEAALTPYVGRERELAALRAAFESAKQGRGQVAFLVGEAGLGKSRLLQEAAAAWRADGVAVLEGGCVELGSTGLPFGPFAAALRGGVREGLIEPDALHAATRRRLAVLVPEIASAATRRGRRRTRGTADVDSDVDPEAAAIVFESGVPITMMGLDVTHQAVLYQPAVDRLRGLSTRSGAVGAELAAFALAREGQWYGTPRMSVHDAVAVAHLAVADLVAVADYNVRVDIGAGPARGKTVCDGLARRVERQGRSLNAQVGIAIDRDRFEDILVEAFAALP